MAESKRFKLQLALFGRALSLLMNRATMYQADHPYFRDALDSFFTTADELIQDMSPLVFIMAQERFFIDEEPLDPRINVNRLVTHFKKAGIQSISFSKGLRKNELRTFMEVFTSLNKYPDAEAMIKAIDQKGLRHVRVNHVYYQKVTSDDEVVSREALKKMTPEMSSEAERKSKKMFLDALLENVLSEELEKTLSVQSLLKNPAGVSKAMIDNDLAAAKGLSGGAGPGLGEDIDPGPGTATGGPAAGAAAGQGPGPGPGGSAGPGPGTATGGPAAGAAAGQGPGTGPGPGGGAGPGPGTATGGPAAGAPAGQGTGAGPGPGGGAGPGPGTATGGPAAGAAAGQGPGTGPGPGGGAGPGTGTGAGGPAAGAAAGQGPGTGPGPGGGAGPGPGTGTGRPGTALAHQLDLISDEIEKSMRGEGEADIQDLAMAVFQMKTELIQGIESQKALGIAYENEEAILEKANELTDKVFLQLIRDEYRSGKTSTARMAQILRRLIPDPDELKRLLPKIKTSLISEGMPLGEYLKLIKELGRELQDVGLARILQESAEEVGVDGEELIEEIKKDPKQAAELLVLAAELRKGDGDDQALTDILVEYVERLGSSMTRDAALKDGGDNEDHLRRVMTGVESKLVKRLREMDVQDDVLSRIENKLNQRLESIVQDIKLDYMRATGLGSAGSKEVEELTVLQTLERSVSERDELAEILKAVRVQVEAGAVDEDDFSQIYAEIDKQKKLLEKMEANREMPPGVLSAKNLTLFIEKEISKAIRYDLPFSAVAFSVVRARYLEKRPGINIPADELLEKVLGRLARIVRDTDVVGKLRKNQMVALLPLTPLADAKLALRRTMKLLHGEAFEMQGVPLEVKVAGSITPFQKGRTPNTETFIDALSKDLVEMTTRVKNIHALL